MKTLVVSAILAFSAAVGVAAETNNNSTATSNDGQKQQLTPEQLAKRKAFMAHVQMKRTGGKLRRPNAQKGAVGIFNSVSDKTESKTSEQLLDVLRKNFRIEIRSEKVASVPEKGFAAEMKKLGVNAAVFVTWNDKCDVPMLYAPEQNWAVINARLLGEGASEIILKDRFVKELARAFALVTGGGGSVSGEGLMNATSVKGLDNFEAEYNNDVVGRIEQALPKIGVTPWQEVTYRRAVTEGWAPAPTNEYQKAIWEELHAAPTKPIVIKPETK